MAAPDGVREFEGMNLLPAEDAVAGKPAAAVVIGDAAEDFTPANLQAAFRLIRGGSAFVAMHKNRWWLTPQGELMDAGAYVAGLEFGTERRALVTGKPARPFFREGVGRLEAIAGRRIPSGDVAMVGDDLWNDILGAQRAGLRGIFVRSGKQGDADLARFASGRRPHAPDGVAPTIAEVVASLTR
jgi:ribonucleotide monophosphatase NagD (HAD superfamily)